ncbi:hypothetical protein EDD11_009725 [Mortierella claussenii]|nr:hypothetical protein EDD11_009725 [Mortierella claussenii]
MAALQALTQRHFKTESNDQDDDYHSPAAPLDFSKHGAPPTKIHSSFSSTKTILRAWGTLLCFLSFLVLITFQIHYRLPTPVQDATDLSGQVQFSEANVRRTVRHLSEDIGYRVVGTEQELETKTYLIKELTQLKEDARVANLRRQQSQATAGTTGLQQTWPHFDMWVQVGDGSHRFDFMSKGKFRF